MKEQIVEICDKKQLVGLLVRISSVYGTTWGIVDSLTVKGEALALRVRISNGISESSSEFLMRLDSAVIYDDDGMIFITGRRREWKFYAYVRI